MRAMGLTFRNDLGNAAGLDKDGSLLDFNYALGAGFTVVGTVLSEGHTGNVFSFFGGLWKGNVWTPLWKAGADAESDPAAAREAGERVQVMGRMGSILETGRLCLCIAADLSTATICEVRAARRAA